MSDNLKNLLNSFKTPDELKAYIEAQQQSLVEVSKKVTKLQQENEELQTKIKILQNKEVLQSNIQLDTNDISNSEIICLAEIAKLKVITESRELTKDESQKFDTYHKILTQINSSKKNIKKPLEGASDEELLSIIQGGKSDVK